MENNLFTEDNNDEHIMKIINMEEILCLLYKYFVVI